MDYEKKYNNIVNTLRSLIDNGKKQGHIIIRIDDIENAIPELAMSEDEKIREALLRGFKNYGISFSYFGGYDVSDIIAWLEKQGEKPQVEDYGYNASEDKELLLKDLCARLPYGV